MTSLWTQSDQYLYGCQCHHQTFCPDEICVGMENDVPIFVRRDSEEGRAAEMRERRNRPVGINLAMNPDDQSDGLA